MKFASRLSMIVMAIGTSCAFSAAARAADNYDGVFDYSEVLTSVSKVGYAATYKSVVLTVTGTNSSGSTVTLSLRNGYTSDAVLTLLIEDCNKKASLAMASPTKFSFGFQFDDSGTASPSATGATNTSSHSYSVVRTGSLYQYEVECFLTPAS